MEVGEGNNKPTFNISSVNETGGVEKDLNESNFIATFSTNYRPKDKADAEMMAEKLDKAIGEVLGESNIENIILFKPEGHAYHSHISSVDIEYSVEMGEGKQGGAIHGHAVISVTHRSNIRLDREVIKKDLEEKMTKYGIESIYVNIRVERGGKISMRHYIAKGVRDA